MAEITATNVATVESSGFTWIGSTWTSLRDATTGNILDTSSDGTELGVSQYSARGATFFLIYRVFFEFDTSGISAAPSEATLKIYGRTKNAGDFYVVRATHSGAPATSDFDAIHGWNTSSAADGAGNGDQIGNTTEYSSEVTSWSTSGYNDIALNAQALADMRDDNIVYICLINFDHDLLDIAPTGDSAHKNGCYYRNYTGTSRDPYLDYTLRDDNVIFFGTNF